MADPHAPPDPMDEAYIRAEAILNDEAERDARRARVLTTVTRAPRARPILRSQPGRWSPARIGRWR